MGLVNITLLIFVVAPIVAPMYLTQFGATRNSTDNETCTCRAQNTNEGCSFTIPAAHITSGDDWFSASLILSDTECSEDLKAISLTIISENYGTGVTTQTKVMPSRCLSPYSRNIYDLNSNQNCKFTSPVSITQQTPYTVTVSLIYNNSNGFSKTFRVNTTGNLPTTTILVESSSILVNSEPTSLLPTDETLVTLPDEETTTFTITVDTSPASMETTSSLSLLTQTTDAGITNTQSLTSDSLTTTGSSGISVPDVKTKSTTVKNDATSTIIVPDLVSTTVLTTISTVSEMNTSSTSITTPSSTFTTQATTTEFTTIPSLTSDSFTTTGSSKISLLDVTSAQTTAENGGTSRIPETSPYSPAETSEPTTVASNAETTTPKNSLGLDLDLLVAQTVVQALSFMGILTLTIQSPIFKILIKKISQLMSKPTPKPWERFETDNSSIATIDGYMQPRTRFSYNSDHYYETMT